ncbi:hypothetical protein BJX63DRAFT_427387 [Aspergillus granulosus]|uniref:Nucleotidyltransferase family protein n=1 Tax=Aspergillus granulosus TaxID=176169 RepID=A0ABR4I2S5_9EURO
MSSITMRWLAADVARILDEAAVTNILFGWMAVSLVGKDFGFQEIDFVVSDNKLQVATDALIYAGFPLCTIHNCSELESCRNKKTRNQDELKAKNRHHPVAACHFHIMEPGQALVSLHRKSNILWWLPDAIEERPATSNPHLWLSTDSRLHLGSGPWPKLYPIKILNPNWLAKAVLSLLCRDGGAPQTGWDMWYSMAQCLAELEKLTAEKGIQYFDTELKLAWTFYSHWDRIKQKRLFLRIK